jgi:AAA domain
MLFPTPERAHSRVGYRMIDSIELRNFRSFKELALSGFRTVNILVGQSASGKTAFLEAVRLALGATPRHAQADERHPPKKSRQATKGPEKDPRGRFRLGCRFRRRHLMNLRARERNEP